MLQYSLKNQFYEPEVAIAYAGFGYFKIILCNDFESGKYCATIALDLSKQYAISTAARVQWIIYGQIMIWFVPLKELRLKLFATYESGIKQGDLRTS
ncbi:hypothetical protein ACHAXS_007750, partial [Conticribra weissflogii]